MILEILTPEKNLFTGEATSISLPGVDGRFQILNNHAPIISALGAGDLVYKAAAETKTMTITSGFVECQKNKVIILVEGATV